MLLGYVSLVLNRHWNAWQGFDFSWLPSLHFGFQDGLRTFQGYILVGSVSVSPSFPATKDELETQRQAGRQNTTSPRS